MPFALQLYSKPWNMMDCIKAYMEFYEGKASIEDLKKRTRELENKQLRLFDPQITQITQINSHTPNR